MATSAVTPASASTPPNFYQQAATAQQGPGAAAPPDFSQQNQQFKQAVTKLLAIFDKMEKMTPNGQKVDKDIKAMATTLKACRDRVFEGEEGEAEDAGQAGAGESAGTAGDSKAAGGSGAAAVVPATSPVPAGAGA